MPKSDRDIEGLLEDWLEDDARPMPQHVLESSLEAVARSNQTSAHGSLAGRWWSQKRLALALAGTAVLLVVVAGSTILGSLGGLFGPIPGFAPDDSPAEMLVWNPATEFQMPPDQKNPSPDGYGNPGVWSYLRSLTDSDDPTSYLLLPNFQSAPPHWYERDLVNLIVGYDARPGVITLHGWSDGIRDHNHDAILGWRSPVAGTIHLRGAVWSPTPSCGEPADGPTFTIQLDRSLVASYPLGLGGSKDLDLTVEVEAGQSLYFSNDPGLDARCDNIFLRLTIIGN